MNIKQFFTSLGLLFLLAFFIIGGCNKDNNTNVNFTIDLTQSQFSQLQTFGGQVVYNGIIIVHTANNTYVAVSAYCTLDNEVLSYNASYDYFVCPSAHEFNEVGACINATAPALITYHTNLINNLLQIYS